MTRALTRRDVVRGAALAALVGPSLARRAASEIGNDDRRFGPPKPFGFDQLIARARELSRQPYSPPPQPDPMLVRQIDYDAYGKIGSNRDYALDAHGPGIFPITLKHVGALFPKTVRMHAVSGGTAREILYSPAYFKMPEGHVARGLSEQPSAFAGFWIHELRLSHAPFEEEPWVTFLGASYFRAIGELGQVGQSARGIALGTGDPGLEEFPDFTEYYFQPTLAESEPVVVHALLDGPSIAGAYRFTIRRTNGVVMDVDCRLFPRREIPRLGIAPLTSMFWFAEYDKRAREDWRPEVHDADGLAIWNGNGEHLWRPLNNPPRAVTSSFFDVNPRGFGLAQRDRDFEHYLDGVGYHLRPTSWVEPLGDWGRGAVQLVEIPTDDEIYDNVVAFWVAEKAPKAGDELSYQYRLHWLANEPCFPDDRLAKVFRMGIGRGGQPGHYRPPGVYKFMVDFTGGRLARLPEGEQPVPVIDASVGTVSQIHAERTPFTDRWRVTFDLEASAGEVAELRMSFSHQGRPASETWLYQLHPPVVA